MKIFNQVYIQYLFINYSLLSLKFIYLNYVSSIFSTTILVRKSQFIFCPSIRTLNIVAKEKEFPI